MVKILKALHDAQARGHTLEFTFPSRRRASLGPLGLRLSMSSSLQKEEMGRFVICEDRYRVRERYKIALVHKTEPQAFGYETFYLRDLESMLERNEDFALHDVPMDLSNMQYRVDPLEGAFDPSIEAKISMMSQKALDVLLYLAEYDAFDGHARVLPRSRLTQELQDQQLIYRDHADHYTLTQESKAMVLHIRARDRSMQDPFLVMLQAAHQFKAQKMAALVAG